jgi:hypothetical protein
MAVAMTVSPKISFHCLKLRFEVKISASRSWRLDINTAVIYDRDRGEGRCSAYCPRSPADLTPELFEKATRDLMPPSKVPINLEAFEMGRRALVAA